MWPWLALLFTSAVVIAAIAWEVWPRTVDLSLVRPRPPRSQAPSAPAAEPVRVRLFFPNTAKANLVEEERAIPRRSVLADAVQAMLQELTRTSGPHTAAPFPPSAELRQVFLDQFGILYLDFNTGIEALLAGDETRATLAVAAITLSLATNFSQVKRVQFLVNGHDWAAQVGTVDLRRPLQPRFPEEESPAVLSKPPEGKP